VILIVDNLLSDKIPYEHQMKKTRRRYDRDFKILVLAELEGGKSQARIAHEHGIPPSLPSRWKDELAKNPETAFSGNGNRYKIKAQTAELERTAAQRYAENELLKNLSHEENPGSVNKTDAQRRYMVIQKSLSNGLQLSVTKSCQVLGVSHSGYYKWRTQQKSRQGS
jgi:transposase